MRWMSHCGSAAWPGDGIMCNRCRGRWRLALDIDFGRGSPHKIGHCPCWRQRGDFVWAQREPVFPRRSRVGGVPEWLKGTDCKSVGFAYAGSNPAPSTSDQAKPLDPPTDGLLIHKPFQGLAAFLLRAEMRQ